VCILWAYCVLLLFPPPPISMASLLWVVSGLIVKADSILLLRSSLEPSLSISDLQTIISNRSPLSSQLTSPIVLLFLLPISPTRLDIPINTYPSHLRLTTLLGSHSPSTILMVRYSPPPSAVQNIFLIRCVRSPLIFSLAPSPPLPCQFNLLRTRSLQISWGRWPHPILWTGSVPRRV
jgi:hypothetical protein